jgi:aminomethyltransferase
VYHLRDAAYLVVVNAGMGADISRHLRTHAQGLDADITDLAGNIAKVDLQGPRAARVLRKILRNPENVLKKMPYFSFKGDYDADSFSDDVLLNDGTPLLLCRTGYTGEFGFEILVAPDRLVGLWELILSAGEEFGTLACGLAARDSLRTGAILPLSHQDIGDWPFINHPWQFALPFDAAGERFTKRFIGDAVLDLRIHAKHTYAFVGYDPRKITPHDATVALEADGEAIGVVTTCVTDLAIGRDNDRIYSITSLNRPAGFKPRGLCCGFVRVKTKMDAGQRVVLKDTRRTLSVEIVDDVRPDRTARRPLKEFL